MNAGSIVFDGALWLAIPIALLAGLVSFLSPCVLPLVPGYLGFLGGATTGAQTRRTARTPQDSAGSLRGSAPSESVTGRGRLVGGVLLFIAGFTLVFVAMGVLAGTLGRFFVEYQDLLTRILGVVVIVMGLVFLGVFGFAQRTLKPQVRSGLGLVGAPLLGIAMGIGWAPCIGPTYTAILSISLTEADPARAVLLAVAYSLGLGIPFLLLAVGFGWATRSVAFLRRHIRTVNIIGGILLVVLGVLMVTGVWGSIMSQLTGVIGSVELPSDLSEDESAATSDPLRPADHADSAPQTPDRTGIAQPRLGVIGWLRWGWRQLTSMRTALVLLLLLAIAAIPGSIVPQRTADPNGVAQYQTNNPDLYPILDKLQLFDVYSSAWFSAIYILLFISLIGCVIPRTKHHFTALKARPPRTPVRLSRLDDHAEVSRRLAEGTDAEAAAAHAVDLAQTQLRKAGYRVERYDGRGAASVSAERGYARETGNLVFHAALVGVLISVGVGGGLTYTGQGVIVAGDNFVNSLGLGGYTSFNPGRFVDTEALPPYALTLDSFDVSYVPVGEAGQGQAGDFAAHVTVTEPGQKSAPGVVRVNHPLEVEGDRVYLMGNGYAPTITVRNTDGDVVFREDVEFLPQDGNMTSQGVIKVPDGLAEQLGMVGFFYPTAIEQHSGAFASAYPSLANPLLTLWVYSGDLGIDDGTARNVYALDPTGMTQLAGGTSDAKALQLEPGQTVDLPEGLGTITFEDATAEGAPEPVKRYVSLSIHRDVGAPFVLGFAVVALLGLLAALFVPRRRMWVKATPSADGSTLVIEYAGLARGEDPAIAVAVADLERTHGDALDADGGFARADAAEPASPTDARA